MCVLYKTSDLVDCDVFLLSNKKGPRQRTLFQRMKGVHQVLVCMP